MGANFQQGIVSSVLGYGLGQAAAAPHQENINRGQQHLQDVSPANNIPAGSMQQQYAGVQDWARGGVGGVQQGRPAGFTATARQYADITAQLQNFKKPDGSIDFGAAQAAGVRLDLLGMNPTNPSPTDVGNAAYTDRAATQAAADENQARALALGDETRAGMEENQRGIDQTAMGVQNDFNNLMGRVDETAATAAQMPGQVAEYNAGTMATLRAQQTTQVEQLGNIIGQGFARLDADSREAMQGIADNMARDLSASTAATRTNLNNNLAKINSDPNLPPEARARLTSQVTAQASQEAANQAAPIRQFYRNLETTTKTSFSKIFADFSSTAQGVQGKLAGEQQGTAGQLGAVHSNVYAQSVEAVSNINKELTGIVQTANANKGTTMAYLDNLRFQVENSGNTLLSTLLPSQENVYIPSSPIDNMMFGIQNDINTLRYQEGLTDINIDLAQANLAIGAGTAGVQGVQGMRTAPQPSSDSGAQIGSSLIGAAGGIGAAAILASDKNMKEGFQDINVQEVLSQLKGLDISKWRYKGEDVTHIGPMAQDFKAAFGVGDEDTMIYLVDALGVALASIKALAQKVERLEAREGGLS